MKHVLVDDFDNFVKGEKFRERAWDFLGDGIFNSDGERWVRCGRQVRHLSLTDLADLRPPSMTSGFQVEICESRHWSLVTRDCLSTCVTISSSPEHLRVTFERAPRWASQHRTFLRPFFHPTHITASNFIIPISRFLAALPPRGQAFDIQQSVGDLALRIAWEWIGGEDLATDELARLGEALREAQKVVGRRVKIGTVWVGEMSSPLSLCLWWGGGLHAIMVLRDTAVVW
jgi:hypothetical protein